MTSKALPPVRSTWVVGGLDQAVCARCFRARSACACRRSDPPDAPHDPLAVLSVHTKHALEPPILHTRSRRRRAYASDCQKIRPKLVQGRVAPRAGSWREKRKKRNGSVGEAAHCPVDLDCALTRYAMHNPPRKAGTRMRWSSAWTDVDVSHLAPRALLGLKNLRPHIRAR